MTQVICDRCGAVCGGFAQSSVSLHAEDIRFSHYFTSIGAKAADDCNRERDYCRQCLDEIFTVICRKVTR